MKKIKELWHAFARHELVVHKPTGQVLFIYSMIEYPDGRWKVELWSEGWREATLVVEADDVEAIGKYKEGTPIFVKEVAV